MNMDDFFQQLDQLFSEKRFSEAEEFMVTAMAQAETRGDYAMVISICSELGGYYRVTSRFAEGIPLYEKALHYIEKLGLSGSEHHGTTLMNYATMCTQAGDADKALALYAQAASIFQEAGLDKDYRLATLYNNTAMLSQELGQYDKAEESLRRALSILAQLTDSEIEQAITWANLAEVHLAQGRLPDGRAAIEEAMALYIIAGGSRDVHYSAAVNTFGRICFLEENYDEALPLFQQAMALTARDFGRETLSYAALCENVAQCLIMLGKEAEAVPFQTQAAEIKTKIHEQQIRNGEVTR